MLSKAFITSYDFDVFSSLSLPTANTNSVGMGGIVCTGSGNALALVGGTTVITDGVIDGNIATPISGETPGEGYPGDCRGGGLFIGAFPGAFYDVRAGVDYRMPGTRDKICEGDCDGGPGNRNAGCINAD